MQIMIWLIDIDWVCPSHIIIDPASLTVFERKTGELTSQFPNIRSTYMYVSFYYAVCQFSLTFSEECELQAVLLYTCRPGTLPQKDKWRLQELRAIVYKKIMLSGFLLESCG